MRAFRTEEVQRLDINGLRHELEKVRAEKKRLDDYEDDLETQMGKVLRGEADPKPTAPPDPGPRQAFIDDTRDMHLTKAERALKSGTG